VAPEYLEAALAKMSKEFGTVERYFTEGLGIDEGAQKALRAALIEHF
jgi:protein-tyrosine phosphatase